MRRQMPRTCPQWVEGLKPRGAGQCLSSHLGPGDNLGIATTNLEGDGAEHRRLGPWGHHKDFPNEVGFLMSDLLLCEK